METLVLTRFALSIGAAAALLTACGGSQAPIGAPGVMPQTLALPGPTDRTNYKVVYRFSGDPDGYSPEASLIDVGGKLYGTTISGGGYGTGTVFRITTGGTEKVLHSFGNGTDGSHPAAGLIEVGGTLYGTTQIGGAISCYPSVGCGTVFSITPSGAEKVLYSFAGGSDGAFPDAPVINVKGTLYGTTGAGGAYVSYECAVGCGTVFSSTPSGTEKVLHSFGGGGDGKTPTAGLIEVKGKLYGTTQYGGAYGYGTIFSITPNGTEKVLHSFAGGTDGSRPAAGLIDVGGTLYGTTAFGGSNSTGRCSFEGCAGTVFSITLNGTEKVLHNFGGGTDGGGPVASLIEVKGTLYGTTAYGGAYQQHCGTMCYGAGGTVFSITPSGTEKVLHSFAYGTDGSLPGASLTDLGGTLYGTTELGGSGCQGSAGCGTVFALKP